MTSVNIGKGLFDVMVYTCNKYYELRSLYCVNHVFSENNMIC